MPELWEHGDESLPYAEEAANTQAFHNCNVTKVLVQGLGEGHFPTLRAQGPGVSRNILVEPWSNVAVHADSRVFHHERSTMVAARASPGTPLQSQQADCGGKRILVRRFRVCHGILFLATASFSEHSNASEQTPPTGNRELI